MASDSAGHLEKLKCGMIKKKYPFISVPSKENNKIKNIKYFF